MRLKSFEAQDMNEAMSAIRQEMGEEAVILSVIRGAKGKGIKVTAAAGDEAEPLDLMEEESASFREPEPARPREPRVEPKLEVPPSPKQADFFPDDDRPEVLSTLERILSFHAVPKYLAVKIIETAKYIDFSSAEDALQQSLETLYGFSPIDFSDASRPLMLIGPPGTGKTVTAAKLAAQAVLEEQDVYVITCDTVKAGGVEQLRAFTSILGINLSVCENNSQLRQAMEKVPLNALLIIDSAGANPYSLKELGELESLVGSLEVEPILVTSAGGDVQEAADIARAFTFLGPKRLIVTRVDAARRLGSMLVAAGEGQLHFSNIGYSANVADGLERVTPHFLASLLIKYKPGYY